jgi:hypothetical protein
MVFLIQNTQNRDTLAVQIKLSELIIAVKGAKNQLASAEDLSESELENLRKEYQALAERAEKALEVRRSNKKPHLVEWVAPLLLLGAHRQHCGHERVVDMDDTRCSRCGKLGAAVVLDTCCGRWTGARLDEEDETSLFEDIQ